MNITDMNSNYNVINFLYLAQSKTCGDFLRKSRHLNKLTQEELAFELNVSQQYISSLENNSKSLNIDKFVKLCEVLNIIPKYLSKNVV